MKLAYKAYDRSGQPADGAVEAASVDAAKEQLANRGLFVTRVWAGGASGAGSAGGEPKATAAGPRRGGGGGLKALALFMRQLSVLVSTGTPLVEAIGVLGNQVPAGVFREVVLDVRKRVEEGAQLSEAMAAHPRTFDAVCRSLVAAGESRGKLGEMLTRLSILIRQQQKIRGELLGAMVYPVLLIAIACAVLSVMIGFVMPRFEGLFKTLGASLPPTTQALMAVGHFAQSYWWGIVPGLVLSVAGAWVYVRSARGWRRVEWAMVRLPAIGAVVRAFMTARLARVLGVLVEGRVSMLEALALTRQSAGHHLYAEMVARAEEAVTRGEAVSSAFADARLVSPSVYEAVRSGERTGQLGPVLVSVADFLDEDNEVMLKSLMSIVEPVILLALGLVVGAVALSMFVPLFDLTAAGGMPAGGAGGAP